MLTFRSFFLANAAVALLVTSSAARHSDCEALAQVLPGKFRPVSAGDVSTGVKTLRSVNGKFAIRGGGHMGIKVDSGGLAAIAHAKL
jgi:hypothetical protein